MRRVSLILAFVVILATLSVGFAQVAVASSVPEESGFVVPPEYGSGVISESGLVVPLEYGFDLSEQARLDCGSAIICWRRLGRWEGECGDSPCPWYRAPYGYYWQVYVCETGEHCSIEKGYNGCTACIFPFVDSHDSEETLGGAPPTCEL